MCKSSSLAFVLVFAFVFRLEKITWKLIGIISVMTIGVVMMVASEAKFVVIGFVLVILASALSGLRWSLTQMLLIRNPATSNPFSSIFFLAPCMFISILTIAIPVEGFGPLFERFGVLVESEGFFRAFGIILFPGIIAFLMVSSEFACVPPPVTRAFECANISRSLLKRSSVVTLSICGIFKEVITISAAAVIFNDPLTPVNISGLMVTIVSIALYNYIKISKMRQEALEKTHHMHHPEGCHVDHHITDTGYSAVSGAELDDEAEAGIEVALSTGSKSHRRTLSRSHDEEDHHNIIQVGESAVSPMFPGLVDATTK